MLKFGEKFKPNSINTNICFDLNCPLLIEDHKYKGGFSVDCA